MKKIGYVSLAALLALTVAAPAHAQKGKETKKNLVIKEWNTDAKTKSKYLDHVTTYNAEGKKIEEIEYNSDGTQKWRERYEYGPDGKVVKETVYDGKNKLSSVKKVEYDAAGRKKTKYTYNSKGNLKTIKVYEYIVEDES